MNAANPSAVAAKLWLGSAGLFLVLLYLWDGAFFPKPGYDELGLAQYSYASAAGRANDESVYWGGLTSGTGQINFPLILCGRLRMIVHEVCGFSCSGTRLLSAVFCLSAVLMISWLAVGSRCGLWGLAALIIGSQNAVIQSARSMRVEEEIVFLGLTGLLLLLLGTRATASRVSAGVSCLISGAAIAWAAGSHPLGMIFFFAAAVFLALKYFRQEAPRGGAVLAFAGGGLVVTFAAVFPLLSHADKIREYLLIYDSFYAGVNQLRFEAARIAYPRLFALMPRELALPVVFINDSAVLGFADGVLTGLVRAGFWIAVLLCLAKILLIIWRRFRVPDRVLILGCLFVALCGFCLAYPTDSGNYALYPALIIPALAAAFLAGGVDLKSIGLKSSAWMVFGLWALVMTANGALYLAHAHRLAKSQIRPNIDSVFQAKALMAQGLTSSVSYCDPAGWPAGSGQIKSLIFEVANPSFAGGANHSVSFDPEFMNGNITRFPAFGKTPASAESQIRHLAQLLKEMEPASLLFEGRFISLPPTLMAYSRPRDRLEGPDLFLVEGSRISMFQTEIVADFSEIEKSGPGTENCFLLRVSPDFSFPRDLTPDMRTMLAGLDIKDTSQPSIFQVIPQYRLLDRDVASRLARAWTGERRDIEIFRCKLSMSVE